MAREILTDEQWERIAPLLPPQRPKTGRPAKDHRKVVEAILWIDRTGAPWRDLPQEFCPWQSIATRFYRWIEDGVWDHVLAELQRQAGASGDLDWELHHVDGTSIRAPARRGCSCGCESRSESRCSKRGTLDGSTAPSEEDSEDPRDIEALGRSRGGFSTKIHLRAEGKGKPITFLITAGQRHENSFFEALMEQRAVKREKRGRPRIRPERMVADKGYSSKENRRYLRARGIGSVIARRDNEHRVGYFDKEAYRQRNVVERLINRLKQFRRVATRYEKRAVNYRAMLTIAAIVLWT